MARTIPTTLSRLVVRAARLDSQAPEEQAGRRALDEAIEPETEERDALGVRAGPKCDDSLDDIVCERRQHEPDRDPTPPPG